MGSIARKPQFLIKCFSLETERKKTGQDSNRNTNYVLLSWKEEKERETERKAEQAGQNKVSLSHNTHTAECKNSSGLPRSEV